MIFIGNLNNVYKKDFNRFIDILSLHAAKDRRKKCMASQVQKGEIYAEKSIFKIIMKTAPPIMLAQLIQAMYNIVDSYFIGMYSEDGLTALSVIFPIQLLIMGAAIGTGTGVNIVMAHHYGLGENDNSEQAAGTGTLLILMLWLLISAVCIFFMKPFVNASSQSEAAREMAYTYGYIVGIGSLGLIAESIFSKILQAGGNMKRPMTAEIVGALINIVLDPILIFGMFGLPEMGIAGAGIASILGQFAAAAITGVKAFTMPPSMNTAISCTKRIFKLGYPAIVMQCLYTVYIALLNFILAGFCDEAVTVLGLYYKLQTFFFIPFFALETCVVPIISYNFALKLYKRCTKTFWESTAISAVLMLVGVFCFEVIPGPLMRIFTDSEKVIEIGIPAFRLIGLSFVPAVTSWLYPIFFQAIGRDFTSAFLSVFRQLICLVPLFYVFSRISLNLSWAAFVMTELLVTIAGAAFYVPQVAKWKAEEKTAAINAKGENN